MLRSVAYNYNKPFSNKEFNYRQTAFTDVNTYMNHICNSGNCDGWIGN